MGKINIFMALCMVIALLLMQGCKKEEVVLEDTIPIVDNITFTTYNQFALELLKNTREMDENSIISPISIGLAMTMLRIGAAGDTALGIDTALDMTINDFDAATLQCADIVTRINEMGQGFQYESGLGLFIDEGPSIMESYAVLAEDNFDILLKFMNFDDDDNDERVVVELNDWADIKTSNRVEKLVTSEGLPQDILTLMINVNALDCIWEMEFDPTNTRPMVFTMGENKGVSVPTLRGKMNMKVYEDENVTAGFLPLSGGNTSLAILMPPPDITLDEFLNNLKAEDIELWRLIAPEGDHFIRFPEIKWNKLQSLKDPLTKMGAGDMFDTELADFSNLGHNFYLGDFWQTTVFKADETGIAPSTITASDLVRAKTNEEYFFAADRPFLFAAIDNQTGGILIIGTMVNPLK